MIFECIPADNHVVDGSVLDATMQTEASASNGSPKDLYRFADSSLEFRLPPLNNGNTSNFDNHRDPIRSAGTSVAFGLSDIEAEGVIAEMTARPRTHIALLRLD